MDKMDKMNGKSNCRNSKSQNDRSQSGSQNQQNQSQNNRGQSDSQNQKRPCAAERRAPRPAALDFPGPDTVRRPRRLGQRGQNSL